MRQDTMRLVSLFLSQTQYLHFFLFFAVWEDKLLWFFTLTFYFTKDQVIQIFFVFISTMEANSFNI